MEGLIEQVSEASLPIVILSMWVVALYREKSKLSDKLLECIDDLKRIKIEEK